MFDYLVPLAKRVSRGNLPDAYDLYNQADVNGICPSITATGFLCPGRAGHTLIFEEAKDEPHRQSDS